MIGLEASAGRVPPGDSPAWLVGVGQAAQSPRRLGGRGRRGGKAPACRAVDGTAGALSPRSRAVQFGGRPSETLACGYRLPCVVSRTAQSMATLLKPLLFQSRAMGIKRAPILTVSMRIK